MTAPPLTPFAAARQQLRRQPRWVTPADMGVDLSRGRFTHAPHVDMLARAVADAVRDGGRLVVTMPPRHGKSLLVSQWTPQWFLDRHPDRRVILASYASTFAATWGRRVRNSLRENATRVNVRLAPDSQRVDDWATTAGGGMLTVGVGSAVTGRGGDLIVVDDPIKNAAEAFSPTYRESTWDWWTSTLRTRLEPGGALVVLHTRWHYDDLIGRLLAGRDDEHADRWTVLNLPALALDGDPLGRPPGEPLWPQRYDAEGLAQLRAAVGPRDWQALYQQQPTTDEGGILPRGAWSWYDQPRWTVRDGKRWKRDNTSMLFASWDLTFKGHSGTDFVVGQVWERSGADYYLLDQVRGRLTFTDTVQAIRDQQARWPELRAVLVEDKANGPAVMDTLRHEVRGLTPVEPQGGKVARAHAVSPAVHAGQVHLPSPHLADWVDDLIAESALFPAGAHDDQVDALTQALAWLSGAGAPPQLGDTAGAGPGRQGQVRVAGRSGGLYGRATTRGPRV